jgi:hypothetical protein
VPGKISKYEKEFNKLSILEDPRKLRLLIKYGLQDSIALLNCLNKAQQIYINEHSVDIASI